MDRERLVHTFGILLAGMIEAEKRVAQPLPAPRRNKRRRQHQGSGVYVLPEGGDAPPQAAF